LRYVEVGGARVSAIGLGTWQFGAREWGYGEDYARGSAGEIVRRALDLGINLIDTAEIYAWGRSEWIVGDAIKGRREEAFLATKVAFFLPIAPVVVRAARGSARRLDVDRIDLYQVHGPNPLVRDGTSMKGMRRLREQGLVVHVGVSNYSLQRWRDAEKALGGPVLSNQVRYSLVERGPERELVPFARDQGRIVIAYSPLAQGLLSGRYDHQNRPRNALRRFSRQFSDAGLDRAARLIQVLRDVAAAHGVTPAQVALAWLIRRPHVVAIPGASSVEQLEANAAAAELDLTEAEDEALSEASSRY
jgi:aryl-alcohol dehydrogenase-like predicted oxidoreductase